VYISVVRKPKPCSFLEGGGVLVPLGENGEWMLMVVVGVPVCVIEGINVTIRARV